jgi:hypothetical protein
MPFEIGMALEELEQFKLFATPLGACMALWCLESTWLPRGARDGPSTRSIESDCVVEAVVTVEFPSSDLWFDRSLRGLDEKVVAPIDSSLFIAAPLGKAAVLVMFAFNPVTRNDSKSFLVVAEQRA